jgi:hypothetical protein
MRRDVGPTEAGDAAVKYNNHFILLEDENETCRKGELPTVDESYANTREQSRILYVVANI